MAPYARQDARDWARAAMRGVANVIIPSYTSDLRRLSESGVRHDVRREIELGFSGALLVSETALTVDEYVTFTEWATDEAAGRLQLLAHASFNTLEENIDATCRAAAAGAEIVLLSYPPSFYPQSIRDIYDFTRAFCDAVPIGVILFPVPLWGFERIHGAALEPSMVSELVDDCPNIVAVKAEGGFPSIAGFVHLHRLVGDRVIVTMPAEEQGIPLKVLVDLPWMGTSSMEYFGDSVPMMFGLLEDGQTDKALDLFWQLHPARQAKHSVMSVAGSNFAHRYAWKYMGWLNGFNGGPLRMPTMRVVQGQLDTLRRGLQKAGLDVTSDPDPNFFVGRNPE